MSKKNSKKCPNCGASVPENFKYCRKCHAKVDSGRVETLPRPQNRPESKKQAHDPLENLPRPIRPHETDAPAEEHVSPVATMERREYTPDVGRGTAVEQSRAAAGGSGRPAKQAATTPRPESTARGPGYHPDPPKSDRNLWQIITVLAIIAVIVVIAVVLVIKLNRPAQPVQTSDNFGGVHVITTNTAEPEATDPAATDAPEDDELSDVPAALETAAPDETQAPEETPAPTDDPDDEDEDFDVTPADDTVYISGDGVNIRFGPGTEYDIINSESTGYELHRTGRSGNWSQVEYRGYVGYVSDSLITTTKPETTPKPDFDVTSASGTVTTKTDSNLRKGPGTDYDRVTTVSAGTELERTGTVNGWTRVNYDGQELYISSDLLADYTVTDDSGTLTVTSDANIRSGPGTDYSVLGVVSTGTRLTCTGKSGSWYQVDYNSKTGFISESLVNKS